jgi:hypothetical protein
MSLLPSRFDPHRRPLEIQEKPEVFAHALDDGPRRTDLQTGETRVVDAKTGGEKGQKLERFDLIPVMFWRCLARLFGRGAVKYADRNWEKGYSWGLSIGALQRHLTLWLSHQSYDTADGTKGGPIEHDAGGKPIHTGEHHLICVAWHCCALFIFETHKLGTDDRAPTVEI